MPGSAHSIAVTSTDCGEASNSEVPDQRPRPACPQISLAGECGSGQAASAPIGGL